MFPDFGYVATEVIPVDGVHIRRMGMGIYLWFFLKSMQSDKDGTVFWGKPITYEWIAERIPNSPPRRTLHLWMASLRLGGYVHAIDTAIGMKLRVIDPGQWPSEKQLRSQKLVSIDEVRLTVKQIGESL